MSDETKRLMWWYAGLTVAFMGCVGVLLALLVARFI